MTEAPVNLPNLPVAERLLFQPPADVQRDSHCGSMKRYRELYRRSVDDPAGFWGDVAAEFYWKVPPSADRFLEYNLDLDRGPVSIQWMPGAVTNVCYNVLDRNIIDRGLGDKIAFYW